MPRRRGPLLVPAVLGASPATRGRHLRGWVSVLPPPLAHAWGGGYSGRLLSTWQALYPPPPFPRLNVGIVGTYWYRPPGDSPTSVFNTWRTRKVYVRGRVLHYFTFSWHGHGTTHGIPWHPHGIPWRAIGSWRRGGCGGMPWVVPWHPPRHLARVRVGDRDRVRVRARVPWPSRSVEGSGVCRGKCRGRVCRSGVTACHGMSQKKDNKVQVEWDRGSVVRSDP